MMKYIAYFTKLINKILICFYHLIIRYISDIHENYILFEGKPDYSDNPLALSDYLVRNGYTTTYTIFWLVSDERRIKEKFPNEKVIFFQLKNRFGIIRWSSYKIIATAKYDFASHGFALPKEKCLPLKKCILLWHGCGYKNSGGKKLKRTFDLALVPGPLFIKTKALFWNTSEKYIWAAGYPRYDWLLNPTNSAYAFKKKYAVENQKVVIWMPTFRNSKSGVVYPENRISAFPLLSSQADWNSIETFCKDKNIVLLVKLHMKQKEYNIDYSKFQNIKQITNEDFSNANVQLYEFLAITDGLISDYSSVAVDYLLVDKPIGFALEDYELYKETRGFVFDNPLEYMPGHHMYSIDDLKKYLSDIASDNDVCKDQRARVRKSAIVIKDTYSKDIVEKLNILNR